MTFLTFYPKNQGLLRRGCFRGRGAGANEFAKHAGIAEPDPFPSMKNVRRKSPDIRFSAFYFVKTVHCLSDADMFPVLAAYLLQQLGDAGFKQPLPLRTQEAFRYLIAASVI